MAITDLRGLMLMGKTEFIVDKVSANSPSKQLTKLDNLHISLRNKCLISALGGFKITKASVNCE